MIKKICDKCGIETYTSLTLSKYLCSDCLSVLVIDYDVKLKKEKKEKLVDFDAFAKKCYDIAENNGFFDFEKDLMERYDLDSKQIKRIESVFISEIICHASSEHSELFEALRCGRKANIESFIKFDLFDNEKMYMAYKEYIKNTIEGEICDCIIIMFGLAYKLGISLNNHLEWALKFNSLRLEKEGKRHGKVFLDV